MNNDDNWLEIIDNTLQQVKEDESKGKWKKLCIYRVPQSLKQYNPDEYKPKLVSLGPYHNSTPELQEAESHKWRALHFMLKRNNHKINLYLDAVRKLEERARCCYEGELLLTSKQFVKMMVFDGCFLMEFLLCLNEGFEALGYPSDDSFFNIEILKEGILSDIILLENQIPFFVLHEILSIQRPLIDCKSYLKLLAIKPFHLRISANLFKDWVPYEDGFHILDILRRSQLLGGPEVDLNPEIQDQIVPSVSKLKEVGMKFEVREDDRFWAVEFQGRTLRMPRLLVQDYTKSLLLNLIAFEQRHHGCNKIITSYSVLMGKLLESPEDSEYLSRIGIIQNYLGSNSDVVEVFNRMNKGVVIHNTTFNSISSDINRYYKRRWNAWRANLKQKYFGNPWSIISFAAAVLLLSLSFTQTFFSAFQYFKPPK